MELPEHDITQEDIRRAREAIVAGGSPRHWCRTVSKSLGCGYNRAAKIIEEMEAMKIISPCNAVGQRRFLDN